MTALALDGAAGRATVSAAERVRLALLWLSGFSGGFVFVEPSPYEFVIVLTIFVFAMSGLRLRAAHLPLVILLILYCVGFGTAVIPVVGVGESLMWTLVSSFLALTTLFFAAAMAEDAQRRLNALLAGYIASAIVVSIIVIVAYFRLVPGTDLFLISGRARATFKDPNVLGPFLVLPAMVVIIRLLFGQVRSVAISIATLLVILAAELLTFSRGAWGHFLTSLVLLIVFSLITSRRGAERRRVAAVAVVGLIAAGLFVAALLSIGQVSELFQERASLVQSHDTGAFGRFGRHAAGALLVLDYPLGIGPLQFTRYFPEDPHNSFLNAFMAGGWLGGLTYLTLTVVTLAFGLRLIFVAAPWHRTAIAAYSTFVAVTVESYVIDVEHWRHYYLIIGVLWGLLVASRQTSPPELQPALHPVARRPSAPYSPPPFGA